MNSDYKDKVVVHNTEEFLEAIESEVAGIYFATGATFYIEQPIIVKRKSLKAPMVTKPRYGNGYMKRKDRG